MGHLSVLPFMKKFSTYYPMVMLGVRLVSRRLLPPAPHHACSVFTLLSLGRRIMSLVGLGELLEDDSQSEDYRLEGRSLINREKRKRHRGGTGEGPASVRGIWLSCITCSLMARQMTLGEIAETRPSGGRPRFQRLAQGACIAFMIHVARD